MSGKTDGFAQIAADGIKFSEGLIHHYPIEKEEKYFNQDVNINFKPTHKMSTAEELQQELEKQREYYKSFLQDLAPEIPQTRSIEYLTDFNWRMQTEHDIKNFADVLNGKGEWEQLKVPHYWGPLGKATSYYRTIFNIDKIDNRIFLCFKGVDYRANVFVNGGFVGSHEGFFAPFEFDITNVANVGENTLLVVVENDIICGRDGNKIYAATGLGYDDPDVGWHHCPPGMGIYQDVYIEKRSSLHVHDIFVRPLLEEKSAEAWIELYSCECETLNTTLEITICGQNFESESFTIKYTPSSVLEVGMGDSLTEAKRITEGTLGKEIPLLISNGINRFKIPFKLENIKIWSPQTPWLYQIQVKVLDENNNITDCAKTQFGMRSFEMDTDNTPKGALYLNGEKIRLRGSNTMGNEQQCVYKKNFDQLIDDILLAKICNMNFWRLTQRPVQKEIYDYCDRLGLMTQTDLPLFGVLRRNQFCEAVRQTEEMERLIRSHPCNIVVSYINEPFPNASNKPHLHLERPELIEFFKAADIAVHLNNPDRVIKQIDGDYNPPSYGLPDNHCYPAWYNGHGIDVGKLNKGYWLPTKPDWFYGCGEYGSEGLDPVNVMRNYYPKHWLPHSEEEEKTWSPTSIVNSQTGQFHYFFYETPSTLNDWVKESQKHQKWATRFMTEAFRRDKNMVTFAIHLFIDAFPSGWMKTIMDVDRQPKPAFFAYREALTPLMVNLRTDRYTYFSGEEIKLEAWVCNDFNNVPQNSTLQYIAKTSKGIISSGKIDAQIPECSSEFQGYIKFIAPQVENREKISLSLALVDENGNVINDTDLEIEVFEKKNISNKSAWIIGEKAKILANDYNLTDNKNACNLILISDYNQYLENEEEIIRKVNNGANAIFIELDQGEFEINSNKVLVDPCGMLPVHFASRNTGHRLVEEFTPYDFRLWYDPSFDYITPLMDYTFTANNFEPILTSGNKNENGVWSTVLAAAEQKIGSGSIRICQIKLAGRISTNPIAYNFAKNLLNL